MSEAQSQTVEVPDEEGKITTELLDLEDSAFAGRIISLLLQLEKQPVLSKKTLEVVRYFESHSDVDVKAITKRILNKPSTRAEYLRKSTESFEPKKQPSRLQRRVRKLLALTIGVIGIISISFYNSYLGLIAILAVILYFTLSLDML